MKKHLTQEQKRELLQMLENGATSEEIELKFNIKERTVYQYRMGFRGKLIKPLKEQFLEDTLKEDGCWVWQKGKTVELGGVSVPITKGAYETLVGPIPDGLCVYRKCKNPKCVNPEHLYLEGRGKAVRVNSSLTEDDVRIIRLAYADGSSLSQLAKRYEISSSTVSRIVNRKIWSHVE